MGTAQGEVQLKLKMNDGRCLVCNFYIVKTITNYCPSELASEWEDLQDQLADESYNLPGKIHLLLGVGCWIKIIEPEIRRAKDGRSLAHKTKLGYIILADHTDPHKVEQPYIGAVSKGATYQGLMKLI